MSHSKFHNEINKKIYFLNSVTGQQMVPKENDDMNEKIKELIKVDDNKIRNSLLYNDCHDLKPKEIEFFVLWNNFMDNYQLNEKNIAAKNIEEFLNIFINQNKDYIQKNKLTNELILFMNFLLDRGEISVSFFYKWSIKIN